MKFSRSGLSVVELMRLTLESVTASIIDRPYSIPLEESVGLCSWVTDRPSAIGFS